jgi:glycosyltransferase involved in cell wall biosynthesis
MGMEAQHVEFQAAFTAAATAPDRAGISTPCVSVIVPSHNAAASITGCLDALLHQSHADLEVLVCDDGSTDNTVDLVAAIEDPRVSLLCSALKRGSSAARNRGIRSAKGEIIFFTDADVEVDRDWVRNGLLYFDDETLLGIEGQVVYVSDDYSPQYSDRIVQNLHGGQYMTANAAYRRDALLAVGLFSEQNGNYEDRDLAIRLRRYGRIAFAHDARARHVRERYSVRTFMHEATKVGRRLNVEHVHEERVFTRVGPIVRPPHLLAILFPPLILAKLFTDRPRSVRDVLMLLLVYPRLLRERCVIWSWALRNRRLLI